MRTYLSSPSPGPHLNVSKQELTLKCPYMCIGWWGPAPKNTYTPLTKNRGPPSPRIDPIGPTNMYGNGLSKLYVHIWKNFCIFYTWWNGILTKFLLSRTGHECMMHGLFNLKMYCWLIFEFQLFFTEIIFSIEKTEKYNFYIFSIAILTIASNFRLDEGGRFYLYCKEESWAFCGTLSWDC